MTLLFNAREIEVTRLSTYRISNKTSRLAVTNQGSVLSTLGYYTYQFNIPTEPRAIQLSYQSLPDQKHHTLCRCNMKVLMFSQTVVLF